MYGKTVTIFNYHESATEEAYWYPHVLNCVDLNTDRGAIIKKYGHDSTDNAQLHIRILHLNEKEYIFGKNHILTPWLPPKEWQRQAEELLPETITFSPESDFFWEGDWQGGIVTDSDYRGGFYQYMNSNENNVFKITSVGGPYSLIPHFELLAK